MANTQYFIGQGRVYVANRTTNGAISGGFVELGDCDKLVINTKQTFTDVFESQTGNRTKVVHVPVQTDWDFSVDTLNFAKDNLARAFYGIGTDYTLNAAAGSIILISSANLTGVAPYSLTAAYTYGGYDTVQGNVNLMGEYCFRFEGINLTTHLPVIVTVNRVALSLAAVTDLIGTTANKSTLTGAMLPDPTIAVGGTTSQYLSVKQQTS